MSDHNPNALKHLYDEDLLRRISSSISSAYSLFNSQRFLKILPRMLELEMKPRVLLIRDELKRQLPDSYPEALKILMSSLNEKKLSGFDLWPFTEFIQTYGLDHLELSLKAQRNLTVLFTAEFSIRPFLIREPKRTLAFLMNCAEDKDHRVRRWASEGSRPRLPWGMKLQQFIEEPAHTIPILDKLCFDPELFVRKSVANHLNDIAKDHPLLVIKILKRWLRLAKKEDQEKIDWITRHALRTLIKEGHPDALALLGVETKAKLILRDFKLEGRSFRVDDRLNFSFTIESLEKKKVKVVIDYKIHFLRSKNKVSAKVFKLKTIELGAQESLSVSKSHHFKEVTTRVLYPGIHFLEIMVNGKSHKKIKWVLRG